MDSIWSFIILLISCKCFIKLKKNWSFQRICFFAPRVVGVEYLGHSEVVHLPVRPLNQYILYGELQPGSDCRDDLHSRDEQLNVYHHLRQLKVSVNYKQNLALNIGQRPTQFQFHVLGHPLDGWVSAEEQNTSMFYVRKLAQGPRVFSSRHWAVITTKSFLLSKCLYKPAVLHLQAEPCCLCFPAEGKHEIRANNRARNIAVLWNVCPQHVAKGCQIRV